MIARLQRITTILMLVAASGWAWFFIDRGAPFVAALGAISIIFGYAAFLAIEFVLLATVGRDGGSAPPSLRDLFCAWAGEVLKTPAVFCWRQPFRALAEPDSLSNVHQGCRGVLLVHGFMCNRGFWNSWMQRLRWLGVPFIAVNLEPPFGSIEQLIPQIETSVTRLRQATGMAPVIVAHSMGGLAVRAWMASRHIGHEVDRVVTIASPHQGTWLARFFHAPNGVEMRLGSAWLSALSARESAETTKRFICYYGPCDNIVFPVSTATMRGADNRRLEATAHVQMAFHPAVFDTVLQALQQPPSGPVKCPEPTPASLQSTD